MQMRTGLVLLLLLFSVDVHAMVIQLASSVEVDGSGVRLEDLLARGQHLPAGWGDRVVADVPPSAASWQISLSEVAKKLHGYTDMHHVVLRGSADIQVTVRFEAFTFERLDAAIMTFVQHEHADLGRRFQMCRRTGVLPQLPSGTSWVPQVVRLDLFDESLVAHVKFSSSAGEVLEQGSIEIPVVEVVPFWKVSRPLLRGATIREEDIAKRWLPPSDGARYYPAENSVVGMELRRNLQSGQMLSMGSLAEPVYARRGEVVRVQVQHGGMTVTLRARALADGRRDERIPCLNERSGRRLYVRMVSPREAILEREG